MFHPLFNAGPVVRLPDEMTPPLRRAAWKVDVGRFSWREIRSWRLPVRLSSAALASIHLAGGLATSLLFLLLPVQAGAQSPVRTQTVAMERGWNLISLQVGQGMDPAVFAGLIRPLGIGSASPLVSVWAPAPGTGEWQSYQPRVAGYPHDLSSVEPGRGYWVQVDGPSVLTISGPSWEGPVTLASGWNLVGFPGVEVGDAGQSLESVFRGRLADIRQVWEWDATPSRPRYVGYDSTARPALRELSALRPGKGYWIQSGAAGSLALSAIPAIALPPDIDLPPLSDGPVRAVGTEDQGNDLNGNGVLDTAFTQDTLYFPPGVRTQIITFINQGVGRMNWSGQVDPLQPGGVRFITFVAGEARIDTAAIRPELVSLQSGRVVVPGVDSMFGVVASEPGHLTVQVDRSALPAGRHTNTLGVWAGTGSRTVRVVVEVPPVDGDWSGFAVARRVNDRDVALGKIDLYLAVQRENGTRNPNDPALRAIISRDRSLLFPRDVALSGAYFTQREFFLTTHFEVPRGDRNAPPFSTFRTGADDESAGRGFGDFDANGDGLLDNSNPFPFPVRREITLVGTNVNENRLVGRYVETFQNLLPDRRAITVEGEFELERRSLSPSLTSVFNRSVNTNASIGGGGTFSLTNRLSVTNEFLVEGVRGAVRLEFGGAVRPELVLFGPPGSDPTLGDTNGRLARTIALPGTNGVSGVVPFAFNEFNGLPGRGEWMLVVRWASGSERGTFTGWDLQIQGTAAFGITGRIVDAAAPGTPLANAVVVLSGNGKVAQRVTGPDGLFRFDGLTENDFTVFISRPGYAAVRRDIDLFTRGVELGDVPMAAVPVGVSELRAAPAMGSQPFFTRLTPFLTPTVIASLGTLRSIEWDFGDGRRQTNGITGALPADVPVEYARHGSFLVSARVVGSIGTPVVLQRRLEVFPLQVSGGGINWILGATIGSGASGAGTVGGGPVTNRIIAGGITNEVRTARRGTNLLENVRDPASFDYPRYNARLRTPGEAMAPFPHPADTDVFPVGQAPLGTNGVVRAVDAAGRGDSAFTTPPPSPPRHRMIATLGGFVFGAAPARVGAVVTNATESFYHSLELQTGRIEP